MLVVGSTQYLILSLIIEHWLKPGDAYGVCWRRMPFQKCHVDLSRDLVYIV
jgi:hypothetical protein